MLKKIIGICLEPNSLELFQAQTQALNKNELSDLVNTIYVDTECGVLNKLNYTSCLLLASYANNLSLVRYLVEKCDADMEILVCLNQLEEWDNLTFFKSEPTVYSYLNEEYETVFTFSASVLWHICRIANKDNLDIIKYLVSKGADVNSSSETKFNSTPLMIACMKNRLDLVRFLIERCKVNVNQVDKNNETCLFYAVRNNEDCLEMVIYLISKGVCINTANIYNRTVLSYCLNLKYNQIMEKFLSLMAKMNQKLEPSILLKVALDGDHEKFNYFLNHERMCESNELKITAIEILATVLYEKKESAWRCLDYLKLAVQERNKIKLEKNPICWMDGFFPEFKNLEELKIIEQIKTELTMQNLYVRERILKQYPHMLKLAKFNVFKCFQTDNLKCNRHFFDRYLINNFAKLSTIWFYSLRMQLIHHKPFDSSFIENLFDFTQYLSYIVNNRYMSLSEDVRLEYSNSLLKIFRLCLFSIGLETSASGSAAKSEILGKLFNDPNKIENYFTHIKLNEIFQNVDHINLYKSICPKSSTLDFEFEKSTFNLLINLGVFILRLIFHTNIKFYNDPDVRVLLADLQVSIMHLIKLSENFKFGQPLLSLSLRKNIIGEFSITYSNKFYFCHEEVSIGLVEYLLDCGANPNSSATNWKHYSKNTCFNFGLFNCKEISSNKKVFENFILLFLNRGAHLDSKNDLNWTILDQYKIRFGDGSVLSSISHIFRLNSLQCLCARVIVRSNIKYAQVLPKSLSEFVRQH